MGHFEKGRWIEDRRKDPDYRAFYELKSIVHEWGRSKGYYIKMDLKGVCFNIDRISMYGLFDMIRFCGPYGNSSEIPNSSNEVK